MSPSCSDFLSSSQDRNRLFKLCIVPVKALAHLKTLGLSSSSASPASVVGGEVNFNSERGLISKKSLKKLFWVALTWFRWILLEIWARNNLACSISLSGFDANHKNYGHTDQGCSKKKGRDLARGFISAHYCILRVREVRWLLNMMWSLAGNLSLVDLACYGFKAYHHICMLSRGHKSQRTC